MQIEMMKISDLKYADYNPRKMSNSEKRKLKESIKAFGFVSPVIVNDYPGRENTIIGGHQRIDVAVELGMIEVLIIHVSLDEQKEKLLNLALNKISGDWDFLKLHDILEDLTSSNASMYLSGFDEREISAILGENEKQDEDYAPDKPETTDIKCGDIWQLGDHKLICGDSTESPTWLELLGIEKIAIVFTDPPYGIFYSHKGGISESRSGKKWSPISNDDMRGDDLTAFLINVFIMMK